MYKKIATFALAAFIAGTAFAQENFDIAQDALKSAGIMIDIPETATQEQIDQILAVTSDGGTTAADKEAEVKKILGME